jgi:hypothetical protein
MGGELFKKKTSHFLQFMLAMTMAIAREHIDALLDVFINVIIY